ncbi:MAG: preprotein translocase subunit SecE [Clostridia bacterium]|nr:preprotein translocase subunit SecE [Clostridia bacterium]MBR6604228.1 preprotein translocase subunit SecE [Clostridia bacterium]
MATKNFVKVALVSLLTLTLVFLMVPMAFATESDTAADAVTEAVTSAAAETEAEASADSTAAETEAAAPEEGADSEEASEEKTEETGEAAETGDADTTGTATEEKDGFTTGDIVSIAIVAVIVIGAVIYCIKNKKKVAEFFRNVRSECKKIVWTPWKTVRKNTFVVVIIVIVCAIVIGALDLLFSKGIVSLGDLF